MRKFFLLLWLLVPIAAGAYHFGPGQKRLILDDAATLVALAEQHVAQAEAIRAGNDDGTGDLAARGDLTEAARAYTEALSLLPQERIHENRRLRLELAKIRMDISELPQANSNLQTLVDEMSADGACTEGDQADLLDEARAALADSQYYMTWLMRLEGAPRQEWEPQIQAARQTFKYLAENAGDQETRARHAEDLESVIRLARMDLNELQGLPIPSQ